MKDMPTIMTPGLKITSWLPRGDNREVLVNDHAQSIMELKPHSIIGTSSIRRRSQVLNMRRDLVIKLIRGNVDTRISTWKRCFAFGQHLLPLNKLCWQIWSKEGDHKGDYWGWSHEGGATPQGNIWSKEGNHEGDHWGWHWPQEVGATTQATISSCIFWSFFN